VAGERKKRLTTGFWRLLQGRAVARETSKLHAVVAAAGAREDELRELTDEQLTQAAEKLRKDDRSDYDDKDLAQLLALGREAARRTLEERPFDVQLTTTGWMLKGRVVELPTGEGKTLAGAITAAGYALHGWPVHVVSVNDYLARRDAEWMGPLYKLLGVTVNWISGACDPDRRREAYAADVTYASVSEIGFDELRDHTATKVEDLVSPEPGVALVDEADSVLVDEARVPLVLAGAAAAGEPDRELPDVVRLLRAGMHYEIDDEQRNVYLTGVGAEAVERALGGIDLYSSEHVGTTLPSVNVALHAEVLLRRDVDYIVRDGKVQLINPSRGRVARLQRWPDGLQAAVPASYRGWIHPVVLAFISLTLWLLIGHFLLLVLFFKRRSSTPAVLVLVQWLGVALSFSVVLFFNATGLYKEPALTPQTLAEVFWTIVWTIYMFSSQRVRATFIRRLTQDGVEAPVSRDQTATTTPIG